MTAKNTFKEFTTQTPYGVIAGKRWRKSSSDSKSGPQGSNLGPVKVMALHGWMDNAGTFDPLLERLDLTNMDVIALDLPGHGFSSHIPAGMAYSDVFFVTEVRRVLDSLNWTTVCFIGHSMGSSTALLFASLFPKRVSCVINLDNIRMHCWPASECPTKMAAEIDKFIELEKRSARSSTISTSAFQKDVALKFIIEGKDQLNVKLSY